MVVQLEDPAMALLGIVSTMSLVIEPKAGIRLTSLMTKVQPLSKLVVVMDGVTAVFTLLVRLLTVYIVCTQITLRKGALFQGVFSFNQRSIRF